MKIKVERITRLKGTSMIKAFADINIDDSLIIKGIRVVEGSKGLFIAMPQTKGKDNRWYDSIIPLSKEVREKISDIVLTAYDKE